MHFEASPEKAPKMNWKGNRMKITWLMIVGMFVWSSTVMGEEQPVLKTQKEKASYVIGVDIGKTLKKGGVEIDADLLSRGIRDALGGGKLLMNEQEIKETMAAFQQEMTARQTQARSRPASSA